MVMKKTLKIVKRFYHQPPKSLENQNNLMQFSRKKPEIQVNSVKWMMTYVKFHAEKDIRLFIERVGNGNIYRSLRI